MLPYLDLQESEAAPGRELSTAEKLWSNYSARKHDYFLHFHNFIFLLLFYSLIPLPYMLVELSKSKKMNKYKSQPIVKRSLSDMLNCYKDVMHTFLLLHVLSKSWPFPIVRNDEQHEQYIQAAYSATCLSSLPTYDRVSKMNPQKFW